MTPVPLYVLDASVALKWVLREPARDQAVHYLDEFEGERLDLIAPRVFMEEVASALAKRHRRKELSAAQARDAFVFIEQRRPTIADEPDLLPQAFALALQHQVSLWDSLYLAVAIRHRCNLVTADRRFYRAASRQYPFVEFVG